MIQRKERKKEKKTGERLFYENTVELKDVTKKYTLDGGNTCCALNHVSLTVKKGEFVAVCGTSGSGKSTLLHVLGGVEQPTSGSVKVCGRELYEMDDNALSAFRCREIGMVFQFFNLIPVLNVEENIAFPVIASGGKPDFTKTSRILKRLGMENYQYYLPNCLSGGQQQRIAVGRALMNEPSLILADEPTGNLDSRNGKEVMDLFESLCSENGATLIVVTHDERIAARADRIVRIEDGRLTSDDKKEEEPA